MNVKIYLKVIFAKTIDKVVVKMYNKKVNTSRGGAVGSSLGS